MTVIAYRDGVMAADALASDSVLKVAGLRKIARGPDGTLYGCGGRASICCEILRQPCGRVSIWTWAGAEDYPADCYLSIGSGSAVAMGAMFMGASAEEAVRAGIEHGIGCGGFVTAVRR